MSAEVTRFNVDGAPDLVVAGAWSVNALALDAWQLWAFLRAELTAFSESPFCGAKGTRLSMATLRTLHPQSVGVERLTPLGLRLLDEAAPTLDTLAPEARVALVLCLPERMTDGGGATWPQQRRILERELGARLTELQASRGARPPWIRAITLGHASLAYALRELGEAMALGRLDVGLVMGLDTPYDPAWVEALLDARRIFDEGNIEAAIPGEGASLLVVAPRDVARANRWTPRARIVAVAANTEVATVENDVPMMGLGLSRAAVAATEGLDHRTRPLDVWISDMTPEPDRVQEFQLAWPRAAAHRMSPQGELIFLAPQLGDLGAAVMPTAVTFALESFARGAPAGHRVLVTGSAPHGARGVVLLERVGQ